MMKRILRLSTLAGAMAAAALLTTLAPVAQREANAGPYYYGGGYAPRYGGYSGYGYGPYGNLGYTYVAPRAYVYPSVGYGYVYPSQTYNGLFGVNYGNSGYYPQAYRPAYNPYGYGGYGPYGY